MNASTIHLLYQSVSMSVSMSVPTSTSTSSSMPVPISVFVSVCMSVISTLWACVCRHQALVCHRCRSCGSPLPLPSITSPCLQKPFSNPGMATKVMQSEGITSACSDINFIILGSIQTSSQAVSQMSPILLGSPSHGFLPKSYNSWYCWQVHTQSCAHPSSHNSSCCDCC